MTIKYALIPFEFAYRQLATDVRATCQQLRLTYSDVDHLAGVGEGNTSRIASGKHGNYKMDTWLSVCNALDLDPRAYLVLAD